MPWCISTALYRLAQQCIISYLFLLSKVLLSLYQNKMFSYITILTALMCDHFIAASAIDKDVHKNLTLNTTVKLYQQPLTSESNCFHRSISLMEKRLHFPISVDYAPQFRGSSIYCQKKSRKYSVQQWTLLCGRNIFMYAQARITPICCTANLYQ